MADTVALQLAQRGLVTLPKSWRDAYNLQVGDEMTLLDLGGVFVLSPRRSEVNALADSIQEAIVEQGQTLESMLAELRESRQRYEV